MRILRWGRKEPLELPGLPVMWLLTARGRNGSRFTAHGSVSFSGEALTRKLLRWPWGQ